MPITSDFGSARFLKRVKNGLVNIVLATSLTLVPTAAATYTAIAPTTAEAKSDCVPHYLRGMRQPKDALENMLEKERVYDTLLIKYPREPEKRMLNGSIEAAATIEGVYVKLIFPNYVRVGDKIKHYHATGIDTYTQDEFKCVVQDNISYIKASAALAMQDYPRTLNQIIATQEKALKKAGVLKENDKLKDMLDKEIPGYKDLKLRDVLFTPDVKIQDFIPTKYYLGEIAALGVTYINTGIIGIDPKARILDHINGWPTILVHEMTHNNPKLQSLPMLRKFDAELWASFPMLTHEGLFHFLRHPYLRDVRKISKILFNFDSELAYADLTSLDIMTGIELENADRNKKLKDYMEKMSVVSKAIRETAFNVYIPEFYSHPLYYMALNEFLKDNNSAFKLIMYKTFEPTLLGGPDNTRDFINENTDTIKEISRVAMQELKNNQSTNNILDLDAATKAKIKEDLQTRLNKMNPAERKALIDIAKAYGMPQNGNIDDLIEFGLRMHRLGIADFDINTEENLIIK